MDKRYKKDQKDQLPLLKSREQKQGTAHAPSAQHHQKGGQATPPAWPLDTPLPSPHVRNQLGSPLPSPRPGEQVSKGNCYLFSLPAAAAGSPINPCNEFLVCPLINFYWLSGLRTLVGNSIISYPSHPELISGTKWWPQVTWRTQSCYPPSE